MCGINGSLGKAESTVRSMNKATEHRGPDDSGVYEAAGFTIGNNRLAVIDLSPLGHQPMISSSRRYAIAFNGEIYNFEELRSQLEKEGVSFKSHSDTEVILEGFAKWGPKITHRLRGMWALAITDSEKNNLFLARDPFGIKPLYLYEDDTTIAFSSEIKGLLANEAVSREIDTDTIKDVVLVGYPLAPRTILKNVRALLPGEEIMIDLATKEQTSEIQKLETNKENTPPTDDELEKILIDSVKHHLIADVPVGLFFSGGIDSTALAIALNMLGKELNAYHVNVSGRDDTVYARKIAEHLKLNFKEIDLKKENISKLFDEMIEKMDQPFADSSLLPTMVVSREARKDVTVVLSGEGGDELFAGYRRHERLAGMGADLKNSGRFFPFSNILKNFPSVSRYFHKIQGALRAIEKFKGDTLNVYLAETAVAAALIETHEIKKDIQKRISEREHGDGILSIDRLIYLPDDLLMKIDVATMMSSLEGRVPFLDREVFKAVGGVPLSWKRKEGVPKAPLKRFLLKHLPKELVERPKTGFSIPLKEFFFTYKKDDMREALNWYKKNYTGLIPALDSVLKWGQNREDVLINSLGYSLYAITVLHGFSKKIR